MILLTELLSSPYLRLMSFSSCEALGCLDRRPEVILLTNYFKFWNVFLSFCVLILLLEL